MKKYYNLDGKNIRKKLIKYFKTLLNYFYFNF